MLNLNQAIDRFLEENGSPDPLSEDEWEVLEVFKRLLEVCTYFSFLISTNFFYQKPFWYQQALSYKKTPTLCGTVAAFEGYLKTLTSLQTTLKSEGLDVGAIIEEGIRKAEDYSNKEFENPAYLLSIGEWPS